MSSRPCPRPACPNLQPCPKHAPKRPHWSTDRDRGAQRAYRTAVLTRDNHACTRCGATRDLQAHHKRPGNNPADGVTLCRSCHRKADPHAR